MEQAVILSKREQEYLLGAIEASLSVRELRSYFLWTQGQLQALLPHRLMVCMQFGPACPGGSVLAHIDCLHGTVIDSAVLEQVSDPVHGLAPRLARHAQARAGTGGWQAPPLALEAAAQPAAGPGAWPAFAPELLRLGLDNVLLHGAGPLTGGGTCFALFGMPQRPGPRQAYFIELLLPHLHFALQRLERMPGAAWPAASAAAWAERPVSRREMEILHWVKEGKSNVEVGQILGISGLTVKNHLQRIYKTLGVSNRTQAVARGMALRLLDGGAARA
ncbi:LuxR family transcriptional regulator [Massilia sp. Root351]|jgi:transcriptional regulator EpsA|uniref:LuxR C-terminal-related transcriptional regulator n=1 Tax=Massilia sp. Root351 TaxID=1736522 RepID=UPI00070A8E4E|nr:LuxR C-terminal-related transcriptional regulator [Massilia sp. Root351]KQV78658.1 LuxR family transcriptional regulator [Massilia sp. Root351]